MTVLVGVFGARVRMGSRVPGGAADPSGAGGGHRSPPLGTRPAPGGGGGGGGGGSPASTCPTCHRTRPVRPPLLRCQRGLDFTVIDASRENLAWAAPRVHASSHQRVQPGYCKELRPASPRGTARRADCHRRRADDAVSFLRRPGRTRGHAGAHDHKWTAVLHGQATVQMMADASAMCPRSHHQYRAAGVPGAGAPAHPVGTPCGCGA